MCEMWRLLWVMFYIRGIMTCGFCWQAGDDTLHSCVLAPCLSRHNLLYARDKDWWFLLEGRDTIYACSLASELGNLLYSAKERLLVVEKCEAEGGCDGTDWPWREPWLYELNVRTVHLVFRHCRDWSSNSGIALSIESGLGPSVVARQGNSSPPFLSYRFGIATADSIRVEVDCVKGYESTRVKPKWYK